MTQIVTKYNDIAVGDLVTLKSGGPTVVVVGFEGAEPAAPVTAPGQPLLSGASYEEAGPVARVAWIDDKGELRTHRFPIGVLNVKDGDKHRDPPPKDPNAPPSTVF